MEAEKRWVSCSWYHQWAVRFIGARRRRPRTPGCRKRPVPVATRGAGRDGVHRNAIGWGPGHAGCACSEAAPLNPSPLCHPGCSCGRPSSPAWGVQTDSGYEWGGRRDRGGEAVPGAALRVWENGTVPPPARPVPSDPGRVPPVPSLAQPRGGGHPTARLRQREAPELLRGPLAGCWPRAGVRRGCRCGSTEVRAAASPSLSRTLQSESKARRDWADDVISM